PEVFEFASGATARILTGTFAGHSSPVKSYTELLGVELTFTQPGIFDLDVDERFEHGILVDMGDVQVGEFSVQQAELLYIPTGKSQIRVEISQKTRVMLLGGVPFGEELVMWWNFIGRNHDEI